MQFNSDKQQPIISVEQLCWSVSDRIILNDITFDVEPGAFVGLLGPNGSGKSSLLRCLYKYLTPDSGRILFAEESLESIPNTEYAKHVAVVLQHTPQQFHLSVSDVVELGLVPHATLFSQFSKQDKALIQQAIEQVGLVGKEQQDFELLSGGEKQRAMIARAIVQQPKLLIMDEPTSHLDVKYQIQIMELAKSLGITVIASFHDLNLAASICDEVMLIKQGQLLFKGSPEQAITEQHLSDVFDVCTEVNTHPQTGSPIVTYYYGYQEPGYKEQGHKVQSYAEGSNQEGKTHV